MRKLLLPCLLIAACLSGCTASKSPKFTWEVPPSPAPEKQPPTPPPTVRPEAEDLLRQAAAAPMSPWTGEGWRSLFDGQTLGPWFVTDFAGKGEVTVRDGLVVLGMGGPFTGIGCSNPPATMNYEIALDAMRVMGSDFFCALTLPVGTNFCSLIVGGWGGGLVGVSSIDGYDASENETTKYLDFERGRWYRVRMRVTERKLEAWIDDRKVVNVITEDRRISVRPGEIESCCPLGLATYSTTAALRGIRWRAVSGPDSVK